MLQSYLSCPCGTGSIDDKAAKQGVLPNHSFHTKWVTRFTYAYMCLVNKQQKLFYDICMIQCCSVDTIRTAAHHIAYFHIQNWGGVQVVPDMSGYKHSISSLTLTLSLSTQRNHATALNSLTVPGDRSPLSGRRCG